MIAKIELNSHHFDNFTIDFVRSTKSRKIFDFTVLKIVVFKFEF